MHPFSVMFEKTVCNPKLGLVRQCADDIGALLKTMGGLPKLFWIFGIMAKVANQILGFAKCVFVPISEPFRPALVDASRMYISRLVPQWGSFRIAPSAEYLGVLLGPDASRQFLKIQQKFDNISLRIARANSSSLLSLSPRRIRRHPDTHH